MTIRGHLEPFLAKFNQPPLLAFSTFCQLFGWNWAKYDYQGTFGVYVWSGFTFGDFRLLVNFLAEIDQTMTWYDYWCTFGAILTDFRSSFTFGDFWLLSTFWLKWAKRWFDMTIRGHLKPFLVKFDPASL